MFHAKIKVFFYISCDRLDCGQYTARFSFILPLLYSLMVKSTILMLMVNYSNII